MKKSKSIRPKVLVISPHLDDAVFSIGGLLYRMAQKNWDSLLITCFTKSVLNPNNFALACQLDKGLDVAVDYMKIRREEDARACQVLGVQYQWLSFLEAPHRGYQNPEELFQNLLPEDQVYEELANSIYEIWKQFRPDIVLSPVGIGNHVDHQQVKKAIKILQRKISTLELAKFPNSRFYEWFDEPYYSKLHNSEDFPDQTARFASAEKLISGTTYKFDVSEEFKQKAMACAAYSSQFNFQFKNQEVFEEIFTYRKMEGPNKAYFIERLTKGSDNRS